MSKQKDLVEETSEKSNEIPENSITPEIKQGIERIISLLDSKSILAKEITDEVEAIAKKLGVKNKVLNKRISLIQKEKTKGGEITSSEKDIDFVKKYNNI